MANVLNIPQTSTNVTTLTQGRMYNNTKIELLTPDSLKLNPESISLVKSEIKALSTFHCRIDGFPHTEVDILNKLDDTKRTKQEVSDFMSKISGGLSLLLRSGLRLQIISDKHNPKELDSNTVGQVFDEIEHLYGLESKHHEDLLQRSDKIRETRDHMDFDGENFITQEPIDSETKAQPETLMSKKKVLESEPYYTFDENDLTEVLSSNDICTKQEKFNNLLNKAIDEIKQNSNSDLAFIAGAKDFTTLVTKNTSHISKDDFFCIQNVSSDSAAIQKRFNESARSAASRFYSKGYQPMLPGTGINFQARIQHKGIPFNYMMRTSGLNDSNKRMLASENAIDLRVGRLGQPYNHDDLARLMITAKSLQKIIDFGTEHNLCSTIQ